MHIIPATAVWLKTLLLVPFLAAITISSLLILFTTVRYHQLKQPSLRLYPWQKSEDMQLSSALVITPYKEQSLHLKGTFIPTDNYTKVASDAIVMPPYKTLLSSVTSFAVLEEQTQNPERNLDLLDHHVLRKPPSSVCCSASDDRPCVVALVLSSLSSNDKRQLIRETWGRAKWYPQISLKVLFLLGYNKNATEAQVKALLDEAALNEDIIQGGFLEHYRNLVPKMYMGLNWVNENCGGSVAMMLKTDDDVVVDLWSILKLWVPLDKVAYRSVFGDTNVDKHPHRQPDIKWSLTTAEYPHYQFPQFVRGVLYAFTGDLVPLVLEKALVETYVWLEDVFITGLCMQRLDVTYYDWSRYGILWSIPPVIEGLVHMVESKHAFYVHVGDKSWQKTLWLQALHRYLGTNTETNTKTIKAQVTKDEKLNKKLDNPTPRLNVSKVPKPPKIFDQQKL